MVQFGRLVSSAPKVIKKTKNKCPQWYLQRPDKKLTSQHILFLLLHVKANTVKVYIKVFLLVILLSYFFSLLYWHCLHIAAAIDVHTICLFFMLSIAYDLFLMIISVENRNLVKVVELPRNDYLH